VVARWRLALATGSKCTARRSQCCARLGSRAQHLNGRGGPVYRVFQSDQTLVLSTQDDRQAKLTMDWINGNCESFLVRARSARRKPLRNIGYFQLHPTFVLAGT
jgi:hypothetical protein